VVGTERKFAKKTCYGKKILKGGGRRGSALIRREYLTEKEELGYFPHNSERRTTKRDGERKKKKRGKESAGRIASNIKGGKKGKKKKVLCKGEMIKYHHRGTRLTRKENLYWGKKKVSIQKQKNLKKRGTPRKFLSGKSDERGKKGETGRGTLQKKKS